MRSPNFPSIGLPEAISISQKIWDGEKRTAITDERIAKLMGYNGLSGLARLKLSALKKYGLLVKEGGNWKLSDRAMHILHKPKITPEYKQALSAAATSVELFSRLMRTHGHASVETLRSHLIVDHKFTEEGANSCIKAFLATKPLVEGEVGSNNEAQKGTEDRPLAVGAFVQWESQGQAQFATPRQVVGLSEDGEYVFVEDSQTGLPASELSVVDPPANRDNQRGQGQQGKPPANPFFQVKRPDGPVLEMDLPNGNRIEIRLLKKVSKAEFGKIKRIFDLSEVSFIEDEGGAENA